MRRAVLALLAAGCAKHGKEPAELPFELPSGLEATTSAPAPEGPKAGPHYVVEAPPPPPVPADVPGQGPLQPYLELVRKAVGPRLSSCTGGAAPPEPALVTVRVGADGSVVSAELVRSTTDAAWDGCVLGAFRQGGLPAPPAELLTDGSLQTPTMVFR